MTETGYVPLLDITRAELRERIHQASRRFDRLARSGDPRARLSNSDWTVQQAIAHVLTVAHRYRDLARVGEFRRAGSADELVALNQAELDAAMRPIPELADELGSLEPEIDRFFDAITDDGSVHLFHYGVRVDGITAQTNWLGELLLHGEDIARAVKASWELSERDMLLVLRGAMQIGPGVLRAGISSGADVLVALRVPGARPYVLHIRGGTADIREQRSGDRPDAVLRVSASALTQLLYQRIGPFAAARRGLRIVGGRRPWVALRLTSYFDPA